VLPEDDRGPLVVSTRRAAGGAVSSILSKLEVTRRAEAAAYLARHTTMPGSVQ